MGRLAGGLPGHTGGVSNEQRGDADQLAAAADEVEAGRGPVAVSRPGHKLVVLVSAEEWQRLEELESAEATAWWRRDAAERADSGEEQGEGEEGPGLDEAASACRTWAAAVFLAGLGTIRSGSSGLAA
jgi:PHD/YefM family antitoxin component YafN of YafNO toxin-antitoxin module